MKADKRPIKRSALFVFDQEKFSHAFSSLQTMLCHLFHEKNSCYNVSMKRWLPPLNALRVFEAAARHRSRFLVRGRSGMDFRGNGIAIRQVYEGQEMGRVTWEFAKEKSRKKRDNRKRRPNR